MKDETRQTILDLQKLYPHKRSALLPALFEAQKENGYLPDETLREVAALFDLAPVEVEAVATFYTMYFREPVGRHLLQVCVTLPCKMGGSDYLLEHIEKRFGIRAFETTSDGKFTLLKVQCLAECGKAPVLQVNDRYYENVTPSRFDEIIEEIEGTR